MDLASASVVEIFRCDQDTDHGLKALRFNRPRSTFCSTKQRSEVSDDRAGVLMTILNGYGVNHKSRIQAAG